MSPSKTDRTGYCAFALVLVACSTSSTPPEEGIGQGGRAGGAELDAPPGRSDGDAAFTPDTEGGGASTDASAGHDVARPQGALLGAFVAGDLAEFELAVGRSMDIVHKFWAWSDDFVPFVKAQADAQRLAQVTWEPWQGGVGTSLTQIIDGTFDEMLRKRARGLRDVGQPVLLRWGHEMNGNWYPWDGSHNGANADGTQRYIAAYRYLHDVFLAEGATNVLWVFCPNVDSVPADAWNQWQQYYPGDEYVDWLCFDGYNWGTTQSWGSTWQEFPRIAERIYDSLAAKGKPILVGETASAEQGGDKAAWIAGITPALSERFPQIKALSWFNVNKETDWRVNSSPASLAAFRAMASDPLFLP